MQLYKGVKFEHLLKKYAVKTDILDKCHHSYGLIFVREVFYVIETMYKYFYYCLYRTIEKSGNFRDAETFYCVAIVSCCICFNAYSVVFLLKGFGLDAAWDIFHNFRYVVAIFTFAILYFYFKRREQQILSAFESPCNFPISSINKNLYIALFILINAIVMFLSAAFMHRDWIFSGIPFY